VRGEEGSTASSTRAAASPGDSRGDPRPRALALVDGEHYPPVVRAALEHLGGRHRFVAALFLGGTEKLRGDQPERVAGGTAAACAAEPASPARARLADELGLPVLFLEELVGGPPSHICPPR
jgi:hypothetical protein